MDRRALILSAVTACVVLAAGVLLALPRPPRAALFSPSRPPMSPGPAPSVPPRMEPQDLYAAFEAPPAATSFGEPVTIASDIAGRVVLPTGRLVGADAFIIDGTPFVVAFGPGRYPVSVLRVDFASGDRRVAAALVRVAPAEPVRWELALVPGQDASKLGPDEIFGYGVDSGTGAFTSPEATGRLRDAGAYDAYSRAVTAGMFPGERRFSLTVEVAVDRDSGANVVAFASGFGDGAYPTFIGFDGQGRPALALTDFGILDAADR